MVHFPKGRLPPVDAFWSLTMYNAKQAFVDNPIDRYAIGDRDKLKFNEDGSLTLYVQHESPGKEKESNWLPAPRSSTFLCGSTGRREGNPRRVMEAAGGDESVGVRSASSLLSQKWPFPSSNRVGFPRGDVPGLARTVVGAACLLVDCRTASCLQDFDDFGNRRCRSR